MTPTDPCHRKRSIALIGHRGCGKSAVGRELAALLGGSCVDTDATIAASTNKSVAAIFAEEGEGGFRRRERTAIAQAVGEHPVVLSVGGGAILDDQNVQMLKTIATLVWLDAPAAVLWQRINADPATRDTRPDLTDQAGFEEVQRLLAERGPRYARAADLVIDARRKKPRDIATEIIQRLDRANL